MPLNLNGTELAAYLGAGAWLPQIAQWGYKFFTRPFITITPAKNVQIGFTRFGPIFNVRLSINTDKKDALIEFIGVELKHTDGSNHKFEWAGMNEYFSEIRNAQGERQVVHRDTMPITVKLNTLSPVERLFRFHETRFLESSTPILNQLNEYQTYLQSSNPSYHDQFLNSKKFEQYLKFMRESFWWKAGTYTVIFSIRSLSPVKLALHSFQFYLAQDSIDSIKKNLDEIKIDYEFLIKHQMVEGFSGKLGAWYWIDPMLSKSSLRT